ncbi:MAG: hypothetical protein DRI44_01710 [Chlamydiae bacterium]|nr:MAG: hypothetical protein DRI44_01710 [Chlamydiota bacterium]
MQKLIKFFWGNPSSMSIAASFAMGVTLGLCPLGTTIWFLILGLCLIFKTHILSLLTGLITGVFLRVILRSLFEPTGKMILLSNEVFWKRTLSKPVICYLNLNVGSIMGNMFIAILSGLIIFALIFITLNIILPKIKITRSI